MLRFIYKKLIILICIGLIIRIILNNPYYSHDAISFVIWAKYLTNHSLAQLYSELPGGYLAYPPFYYYLLIPLGYLIDWFNNSNMWLNLLIVKIPVFIADILVCILIYKIVKQKNPERAAFLSAALFYLNPAIIFNTSVWGQIDSVIIALALLSIYLLHKQKYLFSLIIYTLGCITKVQMLAIFPLMIVLFWRKIKFNLFIRNLLITIGIGLIFFLPVIFEKGIFWTVRYFAILPNQYPYTSVYAYNLWSIFGFMVSDKTRVFGLFELRILGLILLGIAALLIIWPYIKLKKISSQSTYFAAYLLFFAFAFFPTRIHSRYLIYSLGFLPIYFINHPLLNIALTILMMGNLLLPDKSVILIPLVKLLNYYPTIISIVLFSLGLFLISSRIYFKIR